MRYVFTKLGARDYIGVGGDGETGRSRQLFVKEIYENGKGKSGEAKCEFVQIYPLKRICEIVAKGRLNLSEIWTEI